jgi:hypothetical protein
MRPSFCIWLSCCSWSLVDSWCCAWVEFARWECPLTPMEHWLRQRGGQAVYTASFVDQYVLPVLYPPALSREIQWLLGALVLAINAGVYLAVLRRRGSR